MVDLRNVTTISQEGENVLLNMMGVGCEVRLWRGP